MYIYIIYICIIRSMGSLPTFPQIHQKPGIPRKSRNTWSVAYLCLKHLQVDKHGVMISFVCSRWYVYRFYHSKSPWKNRPFGTLGDDFWLTFPKHLTSKWKSRKSNNMILQIWRCLPRCLPKWSWRFANLRIQLQIFQSIFWWSLWQRSFILLHPCSSWRNLGIFLFAMLQFFHIALAGHV